MSTVDDTVWFEMPSFFTPFNLSEDVEDRVGWMLSNTPTLNDDERLNLVVQQELLADRMRRGGVRYAATAAVRIEDDGPQRLSTAQFTITVRETMVNDQTLDAIGRQVRVTGGSGVGFVWLPAGRALVVVDRQRVYSGTTLTGRPRHRVHVVQQMQLMLAMPQGRHLACLAIGTECLQDSEFYVDVMGAIGRTVSFMPPNPTPGELRPGAISAALDPTGEG